MQLSGKNRRGRWIIALVAAVSSLAIWADQSAAQWCELTQVLEPGGTSNDNFGIAAAMSGDTAVIGSYRGGTSGAGTATVYRRIGSTWQFEATLTASDGSFSDWFGVSVAIDGDTIIVGAHEDDIDSTPNAGSAYIFVRTGTVWTQQQKFTADVPTSDDNFGISVAVSGDTAVIGANEDNVGPVANQGSAWVFVRSGTVWSFQQMLTASDGLLNDGLGISVAVSGSFAFIGASTDDVNGNENQGSVYVFARSGDNWNEQQKLVAPDGAEFDVFGWAVAVSGDTLIASAIADGTGKINQHGSVHVFINSNNTWVHQQKLVASDAAFTDIFGMSVDIDGDQLIVGAHRDDTRGIVEHGSAYIFARSGGAWSEQGKIVAPDAANNDRLGTSVAIAGNAAVSGAILDNIGSVSDQGSAWFVSWSCSADIIGCDGSVDVDDLLAVINAWGSCGDPNDCAADIAPAGGDDVVDVDDLLVVINGWGGC